MFKLYSLDPKFQPPTMQVFILAVYPKLDLPQNPLT
jgi:hypothetical protein